MSATDHVDQITLLSSPSLLCNNLNAMKDMLLYCHDNQASVVGTSGSPIATFTVAQGACTQQAILLEVDDVSMVALASSNGLQIWQIDTQQKVLEWSLASVLDTRPDMFCRGIAMAQAEDGTCVLCMGDSFGKVHGFELQAVDQGQLSCTIHNHQAAIAALASSPPSSSGVSSNVLASCDDNGNICMCIVRSSTSIEQRHSWEGRGVPCISVAVQGDNLIAGFYDGTVHLYNMVDGSMKLEIQAHSRMLCAMDVHPCKPFLATAAEDATFAVWSFSEDCQEVLPLFSHCWTNTLLTGIAFAGESSDCIAVAGYDCDEIQVYKVS